jgi:hypothetical protein
MEEKVMTPSTFALIVAVAFFVMAFGEAAAQVFGG